MTKGDLIEELAIDKTNQLNLKRAEIVVNTIFDVISEALQTVDVNGRNHRVEIRGFGSFEVRSYGAYMGRNPATSETVFVAAKKAPFFKTGKELRERVNRRG
tara:strand:+ start:208 stop:513 length:306 start_codon:yes stop_codon:yes gene_type:complete